MSTAMGDRREGAPLAPRARLVSFGRGVQVNEGEVVPVTLTIEAGRLINLSLPLGAFAVTDGKARFVAAVDVVGLTAVILGIGVGRLAIRTASPIAHAIAEKIRGR